MTHSDKQQARTLLLSVVNNVPASLGFASVQTVRSWCAWVKKARAALDSERSTAGQMTTHYQQLISY